MELCCNCYGYMCPHLLILSFRNSIRPQVYCTRESTRYVNLDIKDDGRIIVIKGDCRIAKSKGKIVK